MIISHSRKFIFLKPMKVAGTSLEIALSRYCAPGDVLTPFGQKDEQTRRELGFTAAQNFLVPIAQQTMRDWARRLLRGGRRKLYFSHARAQEVRDSLPHEIWNSYLKISAVRNPFDYAISRYYWEAGKADLPPFRDWLIENPELLLENRRITHIDGQCTADVMIRYEHFADDLAALSQKLRLDGNLHDDMQRITAKTTSRPRQSTPGSLFADFPEGRKLVQILCHEDIERFGYHAP